MPQPLPSKENSLFKQVVKNYEAKQYKKGLKSAEQILRKVPNHGDTQAMKALILNAQGNSTEAFELAKVALKNDVKSHVCWHVYGLLYRTAKNYEEAIKAYKFALKLDPDSAQISRDLAQLQVQMRDYPGFVQTRMAILKSRPHVRQNWTAMAVAHHLNGEFEAAERILTTYEDTLKSPPPKSDIEHSEAILYKNTIIAESGNIEKALSHLEAVMKNSLDRTAVMEMRARYLLLLDRKEEAQKAYRALLDRNNEYRAYYEGLEKAMGLDRTDDDSIPKLAELYESYAAKSEKVDAARRVPLDFLQGESFKTAADRYLRSMLKRGIPSTFANVKALYRDPAKRTIIEELVNGYASEQLTNGSAENHEGDRSSNKFDEAVLYFLAQHYNYHLSRDLSKALDFIDKALEMNPKAVEYGMTKARIWKHYGNPAKASEIMDEARTWDERDRAINSKCAKYQLRNNENENALKTMSKFTKNETVKEALGDLHDLQCMWYLTEDGEAYLRQGKFGLALKRFHAIYDIFDIWQEDQFDFHSFSLRKGQIRAYVDMIRWEDHLREHPYYSRAAIFAVKAYIMLHDKPHLAHESLTNGFTDMDSMDANERKKAMKKAKREQEKQEKAEAERKEAEKKAATKKPATGADGELKKEDKDPQGTKLARTKEPLQDAGKFLSFLLEFSPKNIEAQNVGFEVFTRKNKHLLALKCLLAASSIDSENPTLHEQTVRFRRTLDTLSEPLPPPVAKVIDSTFTLIPTSTSLSDYNDSFISKHSKSAPHVQAGLKVRQLLDSSSLPQNEKELLATLDFDTIELQDAKNGLSLLGEWKSGSEAREAYINAARKRWPEATVFADA
ncbi:hypothetical protein W97_00599 [Coniosporium apollinis CBS 100218]|uniref:Acetyltransferase n=1 Tax=Coniosporium apollinis (strain CBS 100218) TaxID=1168221 RepID=R7YHK0_CONA1|nr:uncharacterized protein W97_00599 [Coniosporium apollinis CBS 100218]EON61385.1 hypothetical protein W97_00599 [Coniosporium apollinis CBS 100218]